MIGQRGARSSQQDLPIVVPVGGIDATAWSHALSAGQATMMDNVFIDGRNVYTRPGYERAGTVAGSISATLMPYEFGDKSLLLANSNGQLRNALTGELILQHGGGGAKMSYAHISNHLVMACTVGAWYFDGDNAFPSNWVNGPDEFGGVAAHNSRLYYWEKDSLDFYYGPTGAITGELTLFPLSRLGDIRGKIAEMASWTVDAGHGLNDVLVIITTQGDVVVYEGIDPGDSLDWRLTGRYKIANPIYSRKATRKLGADLLIQTTGGVVSLTAVLRGSELAMAQTFSEKVNNIYLSEFYENWGLWQIFSDPVGRFVLLNGESLNGDIYQFVKCLKTGSWVRWSGIAAVDWCALNDEIYFVDKAGHVSRFWVGNRDWDAEIVGTIDMGGSDNKQAFSVSMAGGTFSCDGDFDLEVSVTGQGQITGTSAMQSPDDGNEFRRVVMPVSSRGDTVQMVFSIYGRGERVYFRSAEARGSMSRRRV